MPSRILKVALACLFWIPSISASYGFEIKTRYTTLSYDTNQQLRDFNDELHLGSLKYLLKKPTDITVAAEVENKIDMIVEKVKTILEMFPENLHFNMVLLSSEDDVQKAYKETYGAYIKYIAFYSPEKKTVFISVKNTKLQVVAHEFAHVVIDHYFNVSPPVKIHEVLAQFVETHLTDLTPLRQPN